MELATGKNRGPLLTSYLRAGLDIFPPEFLSSLDIVTTKQRVDLNVTLPSLTSTLIGARLTHEVTNERTLETFTVNDYSGISIRDVVTDPETGVAVEVIKTIVTATAAASLGGVDVDGYYIDVKGLNKDWAIKIASKVLSGSLAGAAHTTSSYIEFPLPDVLLAIDTFNEPGTTNTSVSGTFSYVSWRAGFSWNGEVAIRMRSFGRRVLASVAVTYHTTPPDPATVQTFKLSTGTVIVQGGEYDLTRSLATDPSGSTETESIGYKYTAVTVPPCITNGITSGTLQAGAGMPDPRAPIELKLDASSPATLASASTFIGDSSLNKLRLGLYEKTVITITVP